MLQTGCGKLQATLLPPALRPCRKPSTSSSCVPGKRTSAAQQERQEFTQVTEAQRDYFSGPDQRPIILFDGVCNICNGGVNLALNSQSAKQAFRFAPLQSNAGRSLLQRCGRQPDDISSIVLVEQDCCYTKSEAILRIGQQLEGPLSPMSKLGYLLPRALRDVAYDQVADNRYTLAGKRQECRSCDDRLKSADFISE